jgi:preprotein translocase subunit SecG
MKNLLNILGIIALVALPTLVFAQPGGGDPAPVPIDGGASILAAAGIAYGVKKYRDLKKSQ